MNLSVNSFLAINKNYNYKIQKQNLPSFHSNAMKTARNIGLAMFASGLLMATSCTSRKPQNNSENKIEKAEKQIIDTKSKMIDTDSGSVMLIELIFGDSTYSRAYFNSHHDLFLHEYNDKNKIEHKKHYLKDGKKVFETIKPDGEKITESINKNERITTTISPNGEKEVFEEKSNGKTKIFKRINYYSNDKIREQYASETNTVTHKKKTLYELFNKRGTLLGWRVSNPTPADSTDLEYDKLGRLVYNKESNTVYEYYGKDSLPYIAISERNGCRRITTYKNGEIQSDFFRAKNGNVMLVKELESMSKIK